MSCGCGGGLPPSLTLRLEAARLALGAAPDKFDELAPKVLAFVTEDADLAALDRPAEPAATGDGPEAVTSRNALINAPLQRTALHAATVAKLVASGIHLLGALVQVPAAELKPRVGLDEAEIADLGADLARYGLTLGMASEAMRDWIVKGPQ